MQAIRTTIDSERLEPIIPLPSTMRNREVEVIVLASSEESELPAIKSQTTVKRKTFMGCLKEYANPALWEKEKTAWADAAVEKHLKFLEDLER